MKYPQKESSLSH